MSVRGLGVVVAFTSCSLACTSSRPSPDGVAVTIIDGPARITKLVVDNKQQSWFVVEPSAARKTSVVCRLRGSQLSCAEIPGSLSTAEYSSRVGITEAMEGATPLVAVFDDHEARYLEPFTWREVNRIEGPWGDAQAIALASGTILVDQDPSLLIAARGSPSRRALGRFRFPLLSRFGAIWMSFRDDGSAAAMRAPLAEDGVGPATELSGVKPWFKACREGDTLGFLEMVPHSDRRRLVMVDVKTGARVESDAYEAINLVCRAGIVAGIATRRDSPSTICTAGGCESRTTIPPIEGLNNHQVTLVQGGLLFVATKMQRGFDQEIVTWRVDQDPPRTLRIKSAVLKDANLNAVPSGAIVLYNSGGLIALDHEGKPFPLTLTWEGTPPRGV